MFIICYLDTGASIRIFPSSLQCYIADTIHWAQIQKKKGKTISNVKNANYLHWDFWMNVFFFYNEGLNSLSVRGPCCKVLKSSLSACLTRWFGNILWVCGPCSRPLVFVGKWHVWVMFAQLRLRGNIKRTLLNVYGASALFGLGHGVHLLRPRPNTHTGPRSTHKRKRTNCLCYQGLSGGLTLNTEIRPGKVSNGRSRWRSESSAEAAQRNTLSWLYTFTPSQNILPQQFFTVPQVFELFSTAMGEMTLVSSSSFVNGRTRTKPDPQL